MTEQETEFSYIDKLTGLEFRFSPKQNEFVVTYRPDAVGESEDRFGVAKVEDADSLPSHVDRSIPVMVDENDSARYFLPDQVTVQFFEKVTREEAESALEEIGSSIEVEQQTPDYYTVSVPQDKGVFEIIRQLSELDNVEFAEPSEFEPSDEVL